MNNLKTYLAESLKVTPREEPITLLTTHQNKQTLTLPSGEVSNADLNLILVPRPYNTKNTLASALSIQADDTEGRPIQGIVFINLASLPDKAETADQFPNEFFATCFHEVCHALGMTYEDIPSWIDKTTGTKYATEPVVTVTSGTRELKFLVTPEAHKYATKRFIYRK